MSLHPDDHSRHDVASTSRGIYSFAEETKHMLEIHERQMALADACGAVWSSIPPAVSRPPTLNGSPSAAGTSNSLSDLLSAIDHSSSNSPSSSFGLLDTFNGLFEDSRSGSYEYSDSFYNLSENSSSSSRSTLINESSNDSTFSDLINNFNNLFSASENCSSNGSFGTEPSASFCDSSGTLESNSLNSWSVVHNRKPSSFNSSCDGSESSNLTGSWFNIPGPSTSTTNTLFASLGCQFNTFGSSTTTTKTFTFPGPSNSYLCGMRAPTDLIWSSMRQGSSHYPAQRCSKCPLYPPKLFCRTCSILLCTRCYYNTTNPCLRLSHDLFSYPEHQWAFPSQSKRKDLCVIHKIHKIHYCLHCIKLICTDCIEMHSNHRLMPLRVASNVCINEINKAIARNKQICLIVMSALTYINNSKKAFLQDVQQVETIIMATINANGVEADKGVDALNHLKVLHDKQNNEFHNHVDFLNGVLKNLDEINDELIKNRNTNKDEISLFVAEKKCAAEVNLYKYLYENIPIPQPRIYLYEGLEVKLIRDCKFSSELQKALGMCTSFVQTLRNCEKNDIFPIFNYSLPINRPIPGYRKNIRLNIQPTNDAIQLVEKFSFGVEGSRKGELCRPWGICVDRMGNFIVSDRRNHRIQIFNSNGILVRMFGQLGENVGQFQLPAGVTTDIFCRIIVADKDNHRIQIFSILGDFLLAFGSPGNQPGQFAFPWDVATNSHGDIAVSDPRNCRIQLFTSHGLFISQIEMKKSTGVPNGVPRGVTFTASGCLIVSDFDYHAINLIDLVSSTIVERHGSEGFDIDQFNRPSGIVIDDRGWIVVADSKNYRLVFYNERIEARYQYPINVKYGNEAYRPSNVALTPEGNIVVLLEILPRNDHQQKNFNFTGIKHLIKVYTVSSLDLPKMYHPRPSSSRSHQSDIKFQPSEFQSQPSNNIGGR